MADVNFMYDDNGIGKITVNRPQVRNALNWNAMQEFSDAISDAEKINDLRVLCISGSGNAFISGADLNQLVENSLREDGIRLTTIMGDALNRLEKIPAVSIAVINGPARGGGAEIAVACDFRIMSVDANIAFVHSKLGLIPGWGGGERLYRIVGYAHALELLATARVINPEEAKRIGLVNRVIPKEKLDETAMGLAKQIVSNSSESIKTIKRLFLQSSIKSANEARKSEREAFVDLWDRDSRRKIFEKLKGKTK